MAFIPFSVSGKLTYPPDLGVPATDRPINLSGAYSSKVEYDYALTGAGSVSVNFGTISPQGAKILQIEVDADPSPAAQPVLVTINGGNEPIEISPGGFLMFGSPKPTTSGILGISIEHTTTATVRVRALG